MTSRNDNTEGAVSEYVTAMIGGQLFGPPPPSIGQLAGSSLGFLALTFALAGWLDRQRRSPGSRELC